jgi:hypothetical protein
MVFPDIHAIRSFTKQSSGKIWIRTALLVIFGAIFGISLYRDMAAGTFHPAWALLALIPCLAIGFWMSRLVPMQVHQDRKIITFSLDKIYLVLIWVLVIAKLVAGRFLGMPIWSDVAMCIILGLMSGRLSGICLRVRGLKLQHQFIER